MIEDKRVIEFLKKHKIKFKEIKHHPVHSCKEMAIAAKIKESEIAKSILFKTESGFALFVLPGNKSINERKFEDIFNEDIELAKPDEVEKIMGCEIGGVHPFGNLAGIKVYCDKDLLKNEKIYCSSSTTTTIEIKTKDFIDITKPEIIDMNVIKKGVKESLGLTTTRKENFSKWYLDVIRRGGFKDQRTPIKGFDVIMPWGYAVWEQIQNLMNELLKQNGVQNAYFPLLIPESFIEKEKEHFKGFKAETVNVTEVGGEPIEKMAIRPTSETIMYYMFSLWVRSYRDLPLKINQWCNVVRWDTKITKPFIRDREFLWQELHTAHATREEALKEIDNIIKICEKMGEYFAMASLPLKRTESDKFPGAEFSIAFDTLVQDGKVFQGPGGHFLAQNFSKAFNIQFTDKNGKKDYVWQTCLGTTTRQIGGIIMHHGDDKGAVLPPMLSPIQVIIIPVLFKGKESSILNVCKDVESKLKELKIRAQVDDRNYSPGFKYHEWELRGVPLRIEIGPVDLKKNEITIVKRYNNEEVSIKINEIDKIPKILDEIQKEMFERSKKFLKEHIHDARDMEELKKAIKNGIARANWCGSKDCEDWIKAKTGAAVRGTLYGRNEKPFAPCVYCNKNAKYVVYIAKAY